LLRLQHAWGLYVVVVLLPDMTTNQRWCAVFVPAMGSFLVGDILGPTVYRKGLDLNEVVILLALVFWFSVWGGVGAVLAVPIMCTVKIVMEEIPHAGTHALARMMAPAPRVGPDEEEELLGGNGDDNAGGGGGGGGEGLDNGGGGGDGGGGGGGGRRWGARAGSSDRERLMGWTQWGWNSVRHSRWYAKLVGASENRQHSANEEEGAGGGGGDVASPLLTLSERNTTRRVGLAPSDD
jgi:hypothetical protein